MKKKALLFIRDIFLLFLLCYLITIVIKKIIRFTQIHQQSLIHELDHTIINQLDEIKRQIDVTKKALQASLLQQDITTLHLLEKKINEAEIEYKKNSHGLILLGPIGTISIVLKENRTKSLMLDTLKTLETIIKKKSNKTISDSSINSIEQGILYNYELLH